MKRIWVHEVKFKDGHIDYFNWIGNYVIQSLSTDYVYSKYHKIRAKEYCRKSDKMEIEKIKAWQKAFR